VSIAIWNPSSHARRADGAAMGLYLYRLMGAAMLDAGMYEGIEADRTTTVQAGTTVLLASLAAGIGAGGWYGVHPLTLVGVSVVAAITWLIWAVLIFHIGVHVLPSPQTNVTLGELLRTTGFATAPGLVLMLAMVPGLSGIIFGVTGLWMLATVVVAVEHALDYTSHWRAMAVCLIAVSIVMTLAAILGIVSAPTLS
jgi:hypothetical protein